MSSVGFHVRGAGVLTGAVRSAFGGCGGKWVMAHLVLVHGVGGVRPDDEWVTPLNLGLQSLGYDPLASPSDSVTVIDEGCGCRWPGSHFSRPSTLQWVLHTADAEHEVLAQMQQQKKLALRDYAVTKP
jgi:hypothetical protein